jgi:hypothetical protein
MTLNKDLFLKDPTTFTIPNDGVTTVEYPQTAEQWQVLRYELRSFVCEGEYYDGMRRILDTYLAHLGREKQPAVWVSGFYGSGKSHFVRVLEHLWRNMTFEDGADARGLTELPEEIRAQFVELSTAGKRRGGLWAAAGKLSAGANINRDILEIVLRSAGLPVQVAPARFVIRLKQQGIYEEVVESVEAQGERFSDELQNMYVSPPLARALLRAEPDFAADQREARNFLRDQYPRRDEIGNEEMLQVIEDVLRLDSGSDTELPCTLLVFDEMQQALQEDPGRTLEVQEIVEALTSRFGSRLLVVGTGQSAIQATPQLQKLQGRFTVHVQLSDRDVETVVREVVLRKDQSKVPELAKVLDAHSGEIDRQLAGTKIAPTAADKPDQIADYPLLPARRRFWERTLRAIDTGTAAQLRTQLRMIHEATQTVARDPVGTVVGGDFIYDQQAPAMLQSGILLPDLATIIEEQDDGTPEGQLRSRLCATIFLIGQLPKSGAAATGIEADATTLADLLVQDLRNGSSRLRQRIPALLEAMAEAGTLMQVEGEYKLQTRESAEWERDYRHRFGRIRGDTARIASDRATALRVAVDAALNKIRLTQGVNRTPRKIQPDFGHTKPSTQTEAVPVWVQDEWATSEPSVRNEARAEGTESPLVFVLLPRRQSDALTGALAAAAAATEVLNARAAQQKTPEGIEARRAMETRQERAQQRVLEIITDIVAHARVYQAGGNEVVGETLRHGVESAAANALVRLFPDFDVADMPGWHRVVNRAGKGDPSALEAVGHSDEAQTLPAARAILDEVSSSGTKGTEIRKTFTGTGYGWPQDAVDGILLALLNAGLISATNKSGQPVTARQIPQSQIGVTIFRREGFVVKTLQRIQLRRLATDVGVAVQPGEEVLAVQRVLQRLEDLAKEVGGPPPLPATPETGYIQDLQSYTGNEQLVRVYESRTHLFDDHQAWTELRDRKSSRLDRWTLLQDLMKQAADLPVAQAVQPQVEAVIAQRRLLEAVDPVRPLLETVTTALREALQKARERVELARERELAAIQETEEWTKLDNPTWRRLFQKHHLGTIDAVDVSTDQKLLEALNTKPLSAWTLELEAIPTRIRQAREEAAMMLAPKAVRLTPASTTLETEAEVDAYLAELREDIMRHIQAGTPVIL